MAFRGRGRGRGYRGGGGFRVAKQEPFILFPDISENLTDAKTVNEEVNLAIYGSRLQKFWNSLYYFDEEKTEKNQSFDRKRLSDLGKQRGKPKKELPNTILRTSEYVPAELARVSKLEQRGQKKVRWNPESDLQRLDIFEKLEQKHQGQVEKGGKEGDEEEEDDERVEDEDEEFSDDGDYNQNIDFDDDEDDFNMNDDIDGIGASLRDQRAPSSSVCFCTAWEESNGKERERHNGCLLTCFVSVTRGVWILYRF